mmetsp:Transcript_25997/g.79997  ORF Transcript_25997/g.79997 Transcript_25997/m.79997 type:complete len:287 (+) Transcript_25997:642-1502(+)
MCPNKWTSKRPRTCMPLYSSGSTALNLTPRVARLAVASTLSAMMPSSPTSSMFGSVWYVPVNTAKRSSRVAMMRSASSRDAMHDEMSSSRPKSSRRTSSPSSTLAGTLWMRSSTWIAGVYLAWSRRENSVSTSRWLSSSWALETSSVMSWHTRMLLASPVTSRNDVTFTRNSSRLPRFVRPSHWSPPVLVIMRTLCDRWDILCGLRKEDPPLPRRIGGGSDDDDAPNPKAAADDTFVVEWWRFVDFLLVEEGRRCTPPAAESSIVVLFPLAVGAEALSSSSTLLPS